MDRYVIRDTYDMKFVVSIDGDGIEKDGNLKKAIIIDNLEKAKSLLDFIENEDYIIEEIILKTVEE